MCKKCDCKLCNKCFDQVLIIIIIIIIIINNNNSNNNNSMYYSFLYGLSLLVFIYMYLGLLYILAV